MINSPSILIDCPVSSHPLADVREISQLDRFDQTLLRSLGCLKALNFQHIAFLGRELDRIPDNEAYKVLWHQTTSHSEQAFMRLKRLCAKGLILPWKSWNPNQILTNATGRARPKKTDVFYILGREGVRWLREKLSFSTPPPMIEELYLTAFPLPRWLTASSCALTLETEGFKLASINDEWKRREDCPSPAFRPDFITLGKNPAAFYIYDSPFGKRAEYFLSHVGRGLNYMSSESSAVILTRTKEAFTSMMVSMQGTCLSENKSRVFVGDLHVLHMNRGHCVVLNAEGNKCILRNF